MAAKTQQKSNNRELEVELWIKLHFYWAMLFFQTFMEQAHEMDIRDMLDEVHYNWASSYLFK